LPGASFALGLLLLINLLNYMDRQVLAAVDPLLVVMGWFEHRLGFKPEDALVGLLGTAFLLVYMLGAPVFARLAERRSRWRLVGAGVILWSVASGVSGLATTFAALLLSRCLVGVGEAAYGPIAPAIISDLYPIARRGRVLAWFYMAIPVGSALGYVLGGWVANSSLGDWAAGVIGIHVESWRWAFYLVVVPGLLLGLRSLFIPDSARGSVAAARSGRALSIPWRDYLIFLRTPSYVLCTAGQTAMTFAIGGFAFWMPYYLENRPGAPAASTLIFGLITVGAGLSGTLLGGIAGDRLRSRTDGSYFLVSGVAMIVGVPIFLASLEAPFPLIWALIFLTIFCLFFNTGPTNTILANVTPPPLRAAAFALNIFAIHALGDVISPMVIGLLTDLFHNMSKAFAMVSLAFPVAGALWLAGSRFLARDTGLDS
jgi:MFS transporter, Spinster family, sphingosine-1-phosphate transporter